MNLECAGLLLSFLSFIQTPAEESRFWVKTKEAVFGQFFNARGKEAFFSSTWKALKGEPPTLQKVVHGFSSSFRLKKTDEGKK